MARYLKFLSVAYPIAFVFEYVADKFFDGRLFDLSNLPVELVVFFAWYGLFYSVAYVILKERSLLWIALYFAIVGPIVEIIIFHRSNLIMDPIIYMCMGLLPFYLWRRYLLGNKSVT